MRSEGDPRRTGARSNRSGAQTLGDVWSGPGHGPSIYLYITRCKLICLARKNTFLLPSKRSCFSFPGYRALSGQALEQTFWEHTEVLVRQGCHLQGVSPHWALEPADRDSSPSSVTSGWAALASCLAALRLHFLTWKVGMTTCPAWKLPLGCHQSGSLVKSSFSNHYLPL